jgi:multidrug efflux pump subunit AcrA (membrane-fusion protein)
MTTTVLAVRSSSPYRHTAAWACAAALAVTAVAAAAPGPRRCALPPPSATTSCQVTWASVSSWRVQITVPVDSFSA